MAVSLSTLVQIVASVKGQEELKKFSKELENAKKESFSLKSGLQALAGALAIGQFVNYSKQVLDTADNLRDLSQKTGFSVQGLSDLKAAAEDGGSSLEGLQASLRKFTLGLAEATDQESKSAKALKALNIVSNESNNFLKDSNAVILQVADRFAKMQDGANKTRLAVDLFGKSGADMIPILNGGAEAIRGLGVAFTDDFADRADQFNDTLNQVSRSIQSVFVRGLDAALPTLQQLAEVFAEFSKTDAGVELFKGLAEGVRLFTVAMSSAVGLITNFVDAAITGFTEVYERVLSRVNQVKALVKGDFEEIKRIELKFQSDSLGRQADFLKRQSSRLESFGKINQKLLKDSLLFGDGTTEQIEKRARQTTKPKSVQTIRDEAPEINKALDDQIKKEKELRDSIEDKIRKIELETEALTLSNEEKVRAADLMDLENKGVEKGTELYGELAEALGQARDRQEEVNAQLEADPFRGAKSALDGYIDNVKNVSKLTENAVGRSLQSLEDTFVDFFTTGKFQWREFANVVLQEIARIVVKKSIIAPIASGISSLFGFEDGGVMTEHGPAKLRKYASGGIADSPQIALFGEGSKPEAFVPLDSSRSIPVKFSGDSKMHSSGNGPVNITVNVSSSGSTDVQGGEEDKRKLGVAISEAVRAELVRQKRAGGLLSAA